jgi:hypothetical protein
LTRSSPVSTESSNNWKSDFVKNAASMSEKNKHDAREPRKEMEEKESLYRQLSVQQFDEIEVCPIWYKSRNLQ